MPMWMERLASEEDFFDVPVDISDSEADEMADHVIHTTERTQAEEAHRLEVERKKTEHKPLANVGERGKALPPKARKAIGNFLHDLGYNKWYDAIPLKQIFDVLDQNHVYPLDEDGTYWHGMLIGGSECGSEGSRHQQAHFYLAYRDPSDITWLIRKAREALHLSWCKMPSGRFEIVAYIG